MNAFSVKADKICEKRSVFGAAKRRFPPLEWLPRITRVSLRNDVIAGLTVGVMVIPQGMSMATLLGVPYVIGLYTAFIPPLVYSLVGTSRQLIVGPVSLESLLMASGLVGVLTQEECPKWYAGGKSVLKTQASLCPEQYTKAVLATTFLVALFQLASVLLGLGFLLRFMGNPVMKGFIASSAFLSILAQVKEILGIKIPNCETVQDFAVAIAGEIRNTSWLCVVLSFAFIAYLFLHRAATRQKKLKRYIGWLEPLGPLIAVIVGALMVGNSDYLKSSLKTVGYVPQGMPPFALNIDGGLFVRVLPTAIGAYILGDMEAIAIGQGLADKHGYSLDTTQELLAQGISNLAGSLFSAFTSTGSFSRSAVNDRTGAQTQLAGFIASLVVMLTLLFLTSLFFFVPRIVLAAIIVTAATPLIDIGCAIKMYRISRGDFLVWLMAAMCVMFLGILQGLAAGVALSLAIVLYETAKPQIAVLWRIPGTTIYRNIEHESAGTFIPKVLICRPGSSLYFANALYVREKLQKFMESLAHVNSIKYLILEMTSVVTLDYSASRELEGLVRVLRRRGIELAFAMVGPRVRAMLTRTGLVDLIGTQWFFQTVNEAVNYCLKHQMKQGHSDIENSALAAGLDECTPAPDSSVSLGSDICIRNDLHARHTVICVNLECNRPDIMTNIIGALGEFGLSVKSLHTEELDFGNWMQRFIIQNASGDKISPDEQRQIGDRVREILQVGELHEATV